MSTESPVAEAGQESRPILAGTEVRQEDIEPQKGLHVAGLVLKTSAAVVLVLALWQFGYWWLNRPPGGAGIGVLVGDTIRLTVFSALMWAASDLAELLTRTHDDLRATRILVARQTYMMRRMGIASGALEDTDTPHRRTRDPE